MSDPMLHAVLNMSPYLWDDSELDKIQRHARYIQASKRIKELEDGIRNLLDVHLQGVDKPAKPGWERKLNAAIYRLSKLIGIEP